MIVSQSVSLVVASAIRGSGSASVRAGPWTDVPRTADPASADRVPARAEYKSVIASAVNSQYLFAINLASKSAAHMRPSQGLYEWLMRRALRLRAQRVAAYRFLISERVTSVNMFYVSESVLPKSLFTKVFAL